MPNKISIKDFKEYLNNLEKKDGEKWHNGRYGATKRLYGDYLYSQDREHFLVNYNEYNYEKIECK